MHPNSPKLLGLAPGINLAIKQVGDRFVAEDDGDGGAGLLNQLDIVHAQEVVPQADGKPADFRLPPIAQVD
jgi:hypothetical protein